MTKEAYQFIGLAYKRAKTGKIQSYQIGVLHEAEKSTIIKLTGQLTGAKTKHVEVITVGKRKLTPAQQAENQAQSDFLKKKDEGYKTLTDLGVEGVHTQEGVPMILVNSLVDGEPYEEMMTLEIFLDKFLPKENTDANGQAKPMLAHEFEKHKKKLVYPVYVQPKFDGVRCLIHCKREDKGIHGGLVSVTFTSRNGKEYDTLTHIGNDIARYMSDTEFVGEFILDGEIYSDELSFQDITSAVKAYKDNSLKLKFRAYDIINGESYSERYQTLSHLLGDINSNHIINTESYLTLTEEGIAGKFAEYITNGFEGAMIRSRTGLYASGARSYDLLKYKEFDDGEFIIKGGKVEGDTMSMFGEYDYNPNEEEDHSAIDSFVFICETNEGRTFDCKPTGTREERARMLYKFPSLIGEYITVKHFGWTDDLKPRFPVGKGIRNYE